MKDVEVGRPFYNRFRIVRSARGSSVPTEINQVNVWVQPFRLVLLIGPTLPYGVVGLLAVELLLLQKIKNQCLEAPVVRQADLVHVAENQEE